MVPSVGQSIGTPDGLVPTLRPEQTQTAHAGAFQKLAMGSLQEAGAVERQGHTAIAGGPHGSDLIVTESAVAVRQTDIAMRLMLQVQGKLVDAWNELRNMQM